MNAQIRPFDPDAIRKEQELREENAQLIKKLKMLEKAFEAADDCRKALALLLDLAKVEHLRIGDWYVYRCSDGLADAMQPRQIGSDVQDVAVALHGRAIEKITAKLHNEMKKRS
jgi:hypothetical protein